MNEKPNLLDRIAAKGLRLETIKLVCPKCGNVWGVRVGDYESPNDVPGRKLVCLECDLED